jgi:hypothetical protein
MNWNKIKILKPKVFLFKRLETKFTIKQVGVSL